MSFLIDINPEMELPSYKLTLHKLNKEPLASLKNIKDLKFSPLFIGINNLSFYVPFYIMENDGTNVKNPIYKLIEGDHLVKVNDMEYYKITNVKEVSDDSGKKYKEIKCKSAEYSLIDKKIIDYKADSRVLYDDSNEMIDGLEKGILNYIFNNITRAWKIGKVDPDLILREGKGIYRSLEFSNSNLIQVFSELQKTFDCIFTFDTINQTIDVTNSKSMMGEDRGLYISDNNFIKNIMKDTQSDGIITRLYLRGKDNISIQSISPNGQPYLDNFQYYENTKYMSQGLIDSLKAYREKIDKYNPDFSPLFNDLTTANGGMELLLNADGDELEDKGLKALEREVNQIQTLIDIKVEEISILKNTINNADGVELSELHKRKKIAQSQLEELTTKKEEVDAFIKSKKAKISEQQLIIDGINENIRNLQGNLSMSSKDNFTDEELTELDSFIKVDTFRDSNYTEHNLEEFRDEGIRQLDRISQPRIQFEIGVVDFLSLIQCQHVWRKFVLGDIVTLEHKEMGIRLKVRLVGYEHDAENNNLSLKFSNTYYYDDDTLYERDLIESLESASNTVNFNADKWNDVGQIEGRIANLVDSELQKAKQNILNAVGQKHLFGDDGLWLYKENPDGTIDDAQIRGINSDIALTDDNWLSVKTAISAKDGINAELIRGKIGEFAELRADQITVGDEGQTIPQDLVNGLPYIDKQVGELDESVSDLGLNIKSFGEDLILTASEAEALRRDLQRATYESTDVINIATGLGITTEKNRYVTALDTLTNYLNLYWLNANYPLEITKNQIDNVSDHFKFLDDRKLKLINKISEVRNQKSESSLIGYIDDIDKDLTGLVDNKIDTWFYSGMPTLSNMPAEDWTSNAIKDKHIGDLYFDTDNGYTYRFTSTSWSYAWERIKDKDIVSAMNQANKAQDTADGKRRIFTSIPNPPYDVGDLWRVTDIPGIDFKICITQKQTGDYNYLNWENLKGSKKYTDDLKTTFIAKNGEILSRVERNEQNTETLEGRVRSAENKITPDAITSTVESRTTILAKKDDIESAIPYTIMFSNENQSFITNYEGEVFSETIITTDVDVFKGASKINASIGSLTLKNSYNQTIYSGSLSGINPTNYKSGSVTWIIPRFTNIPSDAGWIDIPFTINGNTYSKKLTWSKAKKGEKGEDGADGEDGYTPIKGTDYFDGKDGQDGKSQYLWIRYSNYYDGYGFDTDPSYKKYIGIATTLTPNAPSNQKSYTWSLIKGTDGIPGEDGKNGETSYLHIKYSNDGGATFTGNSGEDVGIWIGTYVDFIKGDSSDTSKYTWNKVKGEDGADGRLVNIVPSRNYFTKKKVGSSYQTTPDEILLRAEFQNCSYSAWEYSTDGSSWTTITRTSSSSYYPYINTNRTLTIPKAWSELNNSDFVVFRIKSTTGESDIQTISILYDVGELEARINTAEQSIRPEAITSTVKESIKRGDIEVATQSTVEQTIDKWQINFDYLKASIPPFRYIRSSMNVNGELGGQASWYELEVYDNNDNNIALNKKVTSKYTPVDGWESNNIYTNGEQNFWNNILFTDIPEGEMAWLQVDLGSIHSDIKEIVDYIATVDTLTYQYKLQVSEDGENWTTIGAGDKMSGGEQRFTNTGGIYSGITTITKDGLRVEHEGDGDQYSEMRADGFIRKWEHGEAQYLNDIYASRNATITIDGSYNDDPPYENWTYYYKPNPVKILLPDRFIGREVECFLSLIGYYSGGGAMGHSVTLNFETPINETTKGEHPYVEVCGYVTSENSYQYSGPYYFGLDFQLLVIGK